MRGSDLESCSESCWYASGVRYYLSVVNLSRLRDFESELGRGEWVYYVDVDVDNLFELNSELEANSNEGYSNSIQRVL